MWTPRTLLLGLGLIVVFLASLLAYVRKAIQGYWYDRPGPPVVPLPRHIALVTGANSGVGLECAVFLARCGMTVLLCCRTQDKARKAKELILSRLSGRVATEAKDKLVCEQIDLSSLSSVKACAERVQETQPYLNILVCNGGIFTPTESHTLTPDGFELTWQVNYLSHFLLNELLTALLLKGAAANEKKLPSRVLFTSSGAHSPSAIRFGDINYSEWLKDNPYSSETLFRIYGQSKLAQVMQVLQAQRRHDSQYSRASRKILFMATTPGMARTNIFSFDDGTWWKSLLTALLTPLFWALSRSPAAGARVLNHCAVAEERKGSGGIQGGSYYSNCLPKSPKGKDGCSQDQTKQDQLYNVSMLAVAKFLS